MYPAQRIDVRQTTILDPLDVLLYTLGPYLSTASLFSVTKKWLDPGSFDVGHGMLHTPISSVYNSKGLSLYGQYQVSGETVLN